MVLLVPLTAKLTFPKSACETARAFETGNGNPGPDSTHLQNIQGEENNVNNLKIYYQFRVLIIIVNYHYHYYLIPNQDY